MSLNSVHHQDRSAHPQTHSRVCRARRWASGLFLVTAHGACEWAFSPPLGSAAAHSLGGAQGGEARVGGCLGPCLSPAPSCPRRFIHQVNRAAVTIQRWYRQQVQRRQARAARREHLLAQKREVSGGCVSCAPRRQAGIPGVPAAYSGVSGTSRIETWNCPMGPHPMWGLPSSLP